MALHKDAMKIHEEVQIFKEIFLFLAFYSICIKPLGCTP